MRIDIDKVASQPTVKIPVLVEFMDGTQGEFQGTFKRIDQEHVDKLLDPEEQFGNSAVLDEVLIGVSGIGKGDQELPAEDQLEWVRKTPECVSAAVAAFFKKFAPARYAEKTSKRRRSRG